MGIGDLREAERQTTESQNNPSPQKEYHLVTLTKESLSNSVHSLLGGAKKESSDLIESTLEIIKSTLASGEGVLISGFGKFYLREKDERLGRNPKTGQEEVISKRRVVVFRSSPVLKDKMNSRG